MVTRPSAAQTGRGAAALYLEGDEQTARRTIYRFIEHYDNATTAERHQMVTEPPPPIGMQQLDALLAGCVEFSCARHDHIAPGWVNEPQYFLEQFWFVAGVKALEADAIANSPISFARRAIFLNRHSLTYA